MTEPSPRKPAPPDVHAPVVSPGDPPAFDPTAWPATWAHVSELTPWEFNPQEHPPDQVATLRALIRAHGFRSTVQAHWPTGRLIAGHGRRLAVLAELDADPEWCPRGAPRPGLLPVRWYGGTWSQAKAAALADNQAPKMARQDDELMGKVLAELRAEEEDLGRLALDTGINEAAISDLIRRHERRPDRRQVPGPPTPKPPKTPDSRPGEIYALGPHRLICGDSTDNDTSAALLEGLEGGRADMAFTDPPFAIFGSATGLAASITDDKLIRPAFLRILQVLQARVALFGWVYVCCDWRSWPSWWEVSKGTRLEPKNKLIWRKPGAGLGSTWGNAYEEIGAYVYTPQNSVMRGGLTGGVRTIMECNVLDVPPEEGDDGRGRADLAELMAHADAGGFDAEALLGGAFLDYNRVRGSERFHNAAKPIALVQRLIEASTDDGGTVLDLYGGSGTTLLAAARAGRRAYLSEIEPGWCDVIRWRWTCWAREAGEDPGPGALDDPDLSIALERYAPRGAPRRTPAPPGRYAEQTPPAQEDSPCIRPPGRHNTSPAPPLSAAAAGSCWPSTTTPPAPPPGSTWPARARRAAVPAGRGYSSGTPCSPAAGSAPGVN